MLDNPKDWEKYYKGNKLEKELQRKYSFSDRCRYYMSKKGVHQCINELFKNLDSYDLPLGMIQQYCPNTYLKIRSKQIEKNAKNIVKSNIQEVINDYYYAIEK